MRTRLRKPRPAKRRPAECYIALQFWELESPAFQQLSADATRVYLFKRKRLNFDASNNGHVPFSVRDASKALHSGWRRGANALAELQHYGFTKSRNHGQPGSAIRLATEWQLTAFPCGGQEASKDFMRWDGEVFEPPYLRKKYVRTRRSRSHQKQLPIVTVTTGRLHGEGGFSDVADSQVPENAESVVTVKADSRIQRRHGEDTSTDTTQGGPPKRARKPGDDHWPAQLRRARGLSQAALAARIGTSRGYIASVEQGRRKPRPAMVRRIERACLGEPDNVVPMPQGATRP